MFWAEAWYDHEDKQIHLYVRACNLRQEECGVSQSHHMYFKSTPCKSLTDFARILEDGEWDRFCEDDIAITTHQQLIDARARSREYKRLYSAHRKEAVAMALHSRLGGGEDCLIACLGVDIMCKYVLAE